MRKPSNNDMENIAEDAEAAFWDVVAKAGKKYGVTSGDMDPGAAFKFEHECMAAVKIWFEYNLNESTQIDEVTKKISDDPKYATHKTGKDLYKKMTGQAGGTYWHKWSNNMKTWALVNSSALPKDLTEIPNAPKLRFGYDKNGLLDLIPESTMTSSIKSFEDYISEGQTSQIKDDKGNIIEAGDEIVYVIDGQKNTATVVSDIKYTGNLRVNGRSLQNVYDECSSIKII